MWRDALSAFIGSPRLLEEVLGDDWLLGEEKYGTLARKVKGSTSTAARGSLAYAGTSLVRVDVGGLALGESVCGLCCLLVVGMQVRLWILS